jgi:hypothetical protein
MFHVAKEMAQGVMAGLDPAIHVLPDAHQEMDARLIPDQVGDMRMTMGVLLYPGVPARAGAQFLKEWIPAFVGMAGREPASIRMDQT